MISGEGWEISSVGVRTSVEPAPVSEKAGEQISVCDNTSLSGLREVCAQCMAQSRRPIKGCQMNEWWKIFLKEFARWHSFIFGRVFMISGRLLRLIAEFLRFLQIYGVNRYHLRQCSLSASVDDAGNSRNEDFQVTWKTRNN